MQVSKQISGDVSQVRIQRNTVNAASSLLSPGARLQDVANVSPNISDCSHDSYVSSAALSLKIQVHSCCRNRVSLLCGPACET